MLFWTGRNVRNSDEATKPSGREEEHLVCQVGEGFTAPNATLFLTSSFYELYHNLPSNN